MRARGLVVAFAVLALGLPMAVDAADGLYRERKQIPIGGEGGWDYLTVDASARRLYVSHATKVVVIDIDKETVVGEIAPTPGIEDTNELVAIDPAAHVVAATWPIAPGAEADPDGRRLVNGARAARASW